MNPTNKRQGMAITSLVLGVLGVTCLGLLTGIPAIILGHSAHSRARKAPDQYSGGGLAIAGFVLGYVSVITTFVLAGLLLPALAKAKEKAQSIYCINNMKQIGLAFRIYATDHGGLFPFNASTNENATGQPDQRAAATHPMDAAEVLQLMANELGSPKILVCPADSSKRPARQFGELDAGNVSYEIESGPEVKESNPGEVLARCPIHGHELLCDGSVHQ